MVYIPTLVTWPQVTLKKVVPSTSNRSWTLGRQQLDTHKKKSEKSIEKWLREVAVYNQRVGTSTYFSPHLRVGFFFLALHLPLLLLLLLRPSSVSTSHRKNTNHCHTDITTPSVSRIITPALSPRHHHTDLSWCARCRFGPRSDQHAMLSNIVFASRFRSIVYES